MRRIDEIHLAHPFMGSRRIAALLSREPEPQRDPEPINRKRIQRLMERMGIHAIYPKPRTTVPGDGLVRRYPYLLRGLEMTHANQVWSTDITFIPMPRGFVYLVAIMDWFSRFVLSWRLSNSIDTSFCLEALYEACDLHGVPGIFNTDQGCQFTSHDWLSALHARQIQISMDGRGRALDNVWIERLWRSLKYEEVYLRAYVDVPEARRGIGRYLDFYNDERPHQSLGYRTPREVYMESLHERIAVRSP